MTTTVNMYVYTNMWWCIPRYCIHISVVSRIRGHYEEQKNVKEPYPYPINDFDEPICQLLTQTATRPVTRWPDRWADRGSSTPRHTWLAWKSWRVKTPWASPSLRLEDIFCAPKKGGSISHCHTWGNSSEMTWNDQHISTYFNILLAFFSRFQHVSTHPAVPEYPCDMFCCRGARVVVGRWCPVFRGKLAHLWKHIA